MSNTSTFETNWIDYPDEFDPDQWNPTTVQAPAFIPKYEANWLDYPDEYEPERWDPSAPKHDQSLSH